MKTVSTCLFLTVLLLPAYVSRAFWMVPVINFYLPFTLLEIMILISVGITGVVFVYQGFPFKKIQTDFDLIIGLFLLAFIAAVFVSFDFIGGLGILKAYFIEPVLFFYCLIFWMREKGNKLVLAGLWGSAIWISILALVQKFFGAFVFAPVEYEQGRMTAVYNSANSLALFLGPIMLLVFAHFFKKGQDKWKYAVLFGLFLGVMFLTKSRGGLVSLTGALAVFGYIMAVLKRRWLMKLWWVGPIAATLCLCLFFYFFYENYNFFPIEYNRPYTQGDTLQIRYFIWAGTINMLKDHFFWGAGLNGFKTLYSNQYRLPQYQEQFQYPHNILLTFWVEGGILGLFTFLLLLISAYGVVIRSIAKSKNQLLGAALIAGLSYWVLHGMVDVPYFKNDLSVEFWVILALIENWKFKSLNTSPGA